MTKITLITCFAVLVSGCSPENKNYKKEASDPHGLHQSVQQLTDVIVHDIFSPPVASRIYAYASIAAYEAMLPAYPEFQTLAGQLNELKAVPAPSPDQEYCFPLAGIQAYLSTGRALIFSEEKMDAFEKKIHQEYKDMGIPEEVFKRSVAYGNQVSRHILEWSGGDNYKETRTFPRYTVTDDPWRWKPTPPAYMGAIEPHWDKIRPFVLDSASQFRPAEHPPFDMAEGSLFYKKVYEVYETGVNLSEEENAIASFWDCNPFVAHVKGHVMFATKKITPGGHWLGITYIASEKVNAGMMKAAEAYALASIALNDAFISCWDEKFRSDLIRPETLINQYIDDNWKPLLQTPPFPEYPSGHSVISTAAAVTLTHLFGEPFKFVDSTEVDYGLPARTFESFNNAAAEAAISRLYGGIHYMFAVENGVDQGRKVGKFVINSIQTRTAGIANVKEEN